MTSENINLVNLLKYINPAQLSYQEWLNVGMALKEEGYACTVWEDWSAGDSRRYHYGECEKKWNSFLGNSKPVTGATIVQMAKEQGWHSTAYSAEDCELDWNDAIGGADELVVINKNWIENKEVHIPESWDPVKQLTTYIETLFEASENVGYLTESWEKDGRYIPKNKGAFDRTAGELIEQLNRCNGDIGAVIGDYSPEAGAWIRFNPLDGKGVKNENVTEYIV